MATNYEFSIDDMQDTGDVELDEINNNFIKEGLMDQFYEDTQADDDEGMFIANEPLDYTSPQNLNNEDIAEPINVQEYNSYSKDVARQVRGGEITMEEAVQDLDYASKFYKVDTAQYSKNVETIAKAETEKVDERAVGETGTGKIYTRSKMNKLDSFLKQDVQKAIGVNPDGNWGNASQWALVKSTYDAEALETLEDNLSSVTDHEGGYQDDKGDSGNFYKGVNMGTNHGITPQAYKNYYHKEPTKKIMKALTKDQAHDIYEQHYYHKFGVNELPKDVQATVLNAVANTGGNAIKAIQGLMGMDQNGKMGPITRKAMSEVKQGDFTSQEFTEALWGVYKGFSKEKLKKFGRGWHNRFIGDLGGGKKMNDAEWRTYAKSELGITY